MNLFGAHVHAPETQPRQEKRACRRSCCWNPYELCGTNTECRCHMTEHELLNARFNRYGRK